MFSPTLVPEEVLLDHPERIRAIIVEGSNPILSYSDASRWREAREQLDLLVVIDPAMTETARLADYVLPTPVGYEKWETAVFPRGVPEIYMQVRPPVVPPPPDALPEPEIYVRLCEAMGLYGSPPAELDALAAEALTPAGAMAFLGAAQAAARGGQHEMLVWAYRALGPHLPAPALTAMFFIAHLNAMFRPESVLRTLGPDWEGKLPFEIGTELFRRILAHPEGVEIARQRLETNLEDHLGFADRKIRLAPEPMLPEIQRAIATAPSVDPSFPLVMAAGLRTRWTANTIQRDPAWRKGKGPHCALNLSPVDATALGIRDGDTVRVATRRGTLTMPAQVDRKLMTGHVWMPNGFGMVSADGMVQGANQNELTDVADRDPFTGIPHHRYVRCRVELVAG
jgi:anaerobic selenocysteine-containing dehydrogenase